MPSVHRDRGVILVPQEQLVHKGLLEHKALRVPLVHKEQLDQ